MIKLIINADDFGYSVVFNEKILVLLEKGFIKSTTVLVNMITKEQEAQVKRLIELNEEDGVSVGLHCDFDLNKPLPLQVDEQFSKFLKIFGFTPSHLDGHKCSRGLECIKVINALGVKHSLPVRHMKVTPTTIHTTQPVFIPVPFDLSKTISFLDSLEDGVSCEVGCHPGVYDPACQSSLNKDREKDYEGVLKLQEYLGEHLNIKNISYREL